MNKWYELANGLETEETPLDEMAVRRVKIQVQTALPKRHTRWRIAAVAAALLVLTACSVLAARYSAWFRDMAADPAEPEASEDLLASMGTVINQSQTVDGVTVTLHGALHDGENLLLSASVQGVHAEGRFDGSGETEESWLYYSKEDLEPIYKEQYADEWETFLGYYEQMVPEIQITRPYDPETGSKLLLIEALLTPEAGRELTLHLEQVEFGDFVIAGPFEFTFTPEVRDVAWVYAGEIPMTLDGGVEITVTEVRITPLQVQVTCQGTMDSDGEPPQVELEEVELSSGETAWASSSGGWIWNDGDSAWGGKLRYGPYDRVVDPALVAAVQINGQRLELSQLTFEKS